MKEFGVNCINFDTLGLKNKYHKKQIILDFANELRNRRWTYALISSGLKTKYLMNVINTGKQYVS